MLLFSHPWALGRLFFLSRFTVGQCSQHARIINFMTERALPWALGRVLSTTRFTAG